MILLLAAPGLVFSACNLDDEFDPTVPTDTGGDADGDADVGLDAEVGLDADISDGEGDSEVGTDTGLDAELEPDAQSDPDSGVLECTESADCDEDAGEFCNIDEGLCVTSLESYYTVRVHDVTTHRCNDTTYDYNTAGAKLMYVALLEGDTYVAWGEIVDFTMGTDSVGEEPDFGFLPDILTGLPPDYPGQCPNLESQVRRDGVSTVMTTFHEGAVAPLGCNGEAYVQFRDGSGTLMAITDDHEIEVNEYGTFCSDQYIADHEGNHEPQSEDDAYDVYLCTDNSSSNIDLDTCEKLNVNSLFGLITLQVDLN